MKLEVTYEDEPDRIWLVRWCDSGFAVAPPKNKTLPEIRKFLTDLGDYLSTHQHQIP